MLLETTNKNKMSDDSQVVGVVVVVVAWLHKRAF